MAVGAALEMERAAFLRIAEQWRILADEAAKLEAAQSPSPGLISGDFTRP